MFKTGTLKQVSKNEQVRAVIHVLKHRASIITATGCPPSPQGQPIICFRLSHEGGQQASKKTGINKIMSWPLVKLVQW